MNEPANTLLILSPGFAAHEHDSTCLPSQQQLVLAINRQYPSIKIIIIAFQYPFTGKPYQWYGNTVIPVGGRNRKHFFRLLTWMRVRRRVKKVQRTHRLKGILCFWYGECALLGRQLSKKYKLPCFTWLLGQDAKPFNKYVSLTRAPAETLIAISASVAELFLENYGRRPAHIITNAVTPVLFPEPMPAKDIDIIAVGSLIALKRYDIFVEVIKQVKKMRPSVKAILCGNGEEKGALKNMIKEEGLADNVELAGELSYTDVLQMMQRSRILLHPSSYEGFSGVCLEALYAGAEVISFCNPKNSWIKKWQIAKNVNEMTEMTIAILNDEKRIYQRVLLYDMDDSAHAVMQLFNEAW